MDSDDDVAEVLKAVRREKEKLSPEERERIRAEIRKFAEAYNSHVEKHGVFSDGKRLF